MNEGFEAAAVNSRSSASAGVGGPEHALVGAGLLDHLPARDQALALQLGQLGVELLRQRVPEVGHADVERLGQLVPAALLVQECGQYGVSQGHRGSLFPFGVGPGIILVNYRNSQILD